MRYIIARTDDVLDKLEHHAEDEKQKLCKAKGGEIDIRYR